jgi:integrase
LRRGLGYKFCEQEKQLKGFVRFMEEHDAHLITNKLALEWATLPQGRSGTHAWRLIFVRGFARYLQGLEPRTEVPPTGILPRASRPSPYLYTDKEITKILKVALKLSPKDGLKRWTYYSLLGLLAVSGLRISEALLLRRDNVDLQQGVLTISGTKFGKSRIVPVHPTTRLVLADYANRRDKNVRPPWSPYFFVTEQGAKLTFNQVYHVFVKLLLQTGLKSLETRTRRGLHGFRHGFAVKTLINWYRSGRDVEMIMPQLSTYLGHTHVSDTYWYLSACPELMGQAVLRLERHWGQS